jgi:hypothetical protein
MQRLGQALQRRTGLGFGDRALERPPRRCRIAATPSSTSGEPTTQ